MKIQITKPQLDAIEDMFGECYSMIGGGDENVDEIWYRRCVLVSRMLENNGRSAVSPDLSKPQPPKEKD